MNSPIIHYYYYNNNLSITCPIKCSTWQVVMATRRATLHHFIVTGTTNRYQLGVYSPCPVLPGGRCCPAKTGGWSLWCNRLSSPRTGNPLSIWGSRNRTPTWWDGKLAPVEKKKDGKSWTHWRFRCGGYILKHDGHNIVAIYSEHLRQVEVFYVGASTRSLRLCPGTDRQVTRIT